jgi:hypothetical protein
MTVGAVVCGSASRPADGKAAGLRQSGSASPPAGRSGRSLHERAGVAALRPDGKAAG